MNHRFDEYAQKILKCVNIDEVNELIDTDNTAVIIKQFDHEMVIMKVIEDGTSRWISPIYINFIDSTYEIDEFVRQDQYNRFIKIEKLGNGNALAIFDNLEAEISIIYDFPRGCSYQIVIDDASSGTGSGWGKGALGID